jgi:ribonuclease HI
MMIFTDGACSGNPGPGGWGAVVVWPDGRVRELGGADPRTTNNRMELSAAIAALRAVEGETIALRLYTDSTYVISGITSWLHAWKRRGWKTMEGGTVLNRDLWEELDNLAGGRRSHPVRWLYVRGHTGSPGNERCDEIAVGFSKGKHPHLYAGPISGYSHDILDLPKEEALPSARAPQKKREGGYYLSLLAGKVEKHRSWADCQARVHGQSRAKFKKVFSQEEEAQTLRAWGS